MPSAMSMVRRRPIWSEIPPKNNSVGTRELTKIAKTKLISPGESPQLRPYNSYSGDGT